jgi:lipopolysaccharide transport system permease protein
MLAKLPGIDNKYGYTIYLIAGLAAWSLFSEILGQCIGIFINNSQSIKKVLFPRITLPMIVVGTALLNLVLLLIPFIFLLIVFKHPVNFNIIWLIPLTLLFCGFIVSIGIILGVLNVFFRDISYAMPTVLQILFWINPIVYPITILPNNLRYIVELNPLYPFITAYHNIIVYGLAPELTIWWFWIPIVSFLLCLSFLFYKRAIDDIVDVI